MKVACIIPARMGSTRFFGKPMKKILGTPMIELVYRNASRSKELDYVCVATCDREIYNHITSIGGNSVFTSKTHERCTERTVEALKKIEAKLKKRFDVVVMIQGDEPMIKPYMISKALLPFKKNKDLKVVNLMTKIKSASEFHDLNEPKVVINKYSEAIYFSRCPIPYDRLQINSKIYKQVCVIPFQRNFLLKFNRMKASLLEKTESIDMNRIIENSEKVKMVEIKEYVKSVDTQKDLEDVEKLIINR